MTGLQIPVRHRGFTLVEVLMATTLLAVMMTLLLGSVRIGVRSWESGERRAAAMTHMLAAQNFLRAHLTAAIPLMDMPQSGETADPSAPALLFQGEEARLEYVGTLPPQVRGGLFRFELYVAEHDDGHDLKLAIRPVSARAGRRGAMDGETIEDVTVLENLDSLRIAYLPPSFPEEPSLWQNEWRQTTLPALVRIEITPEGEAPWPPLVVAPRNEGQR